MIFIDTSALYAVMDRDDENHGLALAEWTRLLTGEEQPVTSNYVVVESFALIQNRLGMKALRLFADSVLPVIAAHWLTEEDNAAAVQAVLAADRRELSLVDCASFQLMRRLGLRAAFAFDRHFEEQGFDVLPERSGGR